MLLTKHVVTLGMFPKVLYDSERLNYRNSTVSLQLYLPPVLKTGQLV